MLVCLWFIYLFAVLCLTQKRRHLPKKRDREIRCSLFVVLIYNPEHSNKVTWVRHGCLMYFCENTCTRWPDTAFSWTQEKKGAGIQKEHANHHPRPHAIHHNNTGWRTKKPQIPSGPAAKLIDHLVRTDEWSSRAMCVHLSVRVCCVYKVAGWEAAGGGLTVHMARQVMYAWRLPAVQLQSVWSASLGPKIQSKKLIVGSGNTRHKTLEYMCRYIPYKKPPPKRSSEWIWRR